MSLPPSTVYKPAFPLDFHKLQSIGQGSEAVIPVVVQDANSGAVLMLGYVNEYALRTAFAEKIAVFWSTSRNELWRKGATSGHAMPLIDVRINCEQNSILYLVEPNAGGCVSHDQSVRQKSQNLLLPQFGC
ncbi:MAG: phosphoribosyl-AMP cyclohydrolase [Verrucomicrobia bacterium]|nr:phosphoribosyl-AMP cyclohydrolase [Verrucomicrobiota bacterium]